MVTLLVLLICFSAYLGRSWRAIKNYREGFTGMIRTFYVVGERLSPFVSLACIGLALNNIFFRA